MTATKAITGGRPPGWEETWKSPVGFSGYEASDDSTWTLGEDGKPSQVTGGIRSIDRVSGGRQCKGTLLKARILANSGGYAAVNVTDDAGVRRTMLVHRFILLAHAGECPDGMETRHLKNDPLDCRWADGETAAEVIAAGGNIIYGTKLANAQDQYRNGRKRPEPKPDRQCIGCGALLTTNGKRCHGCVVIIGTQAAGLLWSGLSLVQACERLDYPSETGLHTLAVKYGGYGRPDRPGWATRLRRRMGRILTHRDEHGRSLASDSSDSPDSGDSA